MISETKTEWTSLCGTNSTKHPSDNHHYQTQSIKVSPRFDALYMASLGYRCSVSYGCSAIASAAIFAISSDTSWPGSRVIFPPGISTVLMVMLQVYCHTSAADEPTSRAVITAQRGPQVELVAGAYMVEFSHDAVSFTLSETVGEQEHIALARRVRSV